jgi:hypothetical protein
MTRTLNLLPLDSPDFGHVPAFEVLIAYEDLDTGKRAKKTYDFLVENLGTDCQFTNQMWKFDVLGIPNLREMAVKDSTKADIIIISCHGARLPAEVQAWIELSLREPHRPFALVAMFDEHADCADTRNYLESLAKRGQMEFFAQPESHRDTQESRPLESQGRIAMHDLPPFAHSEERETAVPRWGINE